MRSIHSILSYLVRPTFFPKRGYVSTAKINEKQLPLQRKIFEIINRRQALFWDGPSLEKFLERSAEHVEKHGRVISDEEIRKKDPEYYEKRKKTEEKAALFFKKLSED